MCGNQKLCRILIGIGITLLISHDRSQLSRTELLPISMLRTPSPASPASPQKNRKGLEGLLNLLLIPIWQIFGDSGSLPSTAKFSGHSSFKTNWKFQTDCSKYSLNKSNQCSLNFRKELTVISEETSPNTKTKKLNKTAYKSMKTSRNFKNY